MKCTCEYIHTRKGDKYKTKECDKCKSKRLLKKRGLTQVKPKEDLSLFDAFND